MSVQDAFDREVEALDAELESGAITPKEHQKAMLELQRDYQAAAQEAAQRAHDEELDRW